MEGGPPRFIPGFTCPALLGIPLSGPRSFGYGALTLYRPASQPVPLDRGFLTRPRRSSDGTEGPTTPRAATPGGLHAHGFRLYALSHPAKPTRPELREAVAEIFMRTANGCGHRQVVDLLASEWGVTYWKNTCGALVVCRVP